MLCDSRLTDGKCGGAANCGKGQRASVRSEVFIAVKMSMLFWAVSLCGLVGRY